MIDRREPDANENPYRRKPTTPSPELVERAFAREERYFVVKRKHLREDQEADLREAFYNLDIDTVECVVVERDWPEYETVWAMIEARCDAKPVDPDLVLAREIAAEESEERFPELTYGEAVRRGDQDNDSVVKVALAAIKAADARRAEKSA